MTPDQWLARLTKAIDDRADRLRTLRSYMEGNAPLPEGAEGCREAYQAFQKKARTNFGELATEAVTERLIPGGYDLPGTLSEEAVRGTVQQVTPETAQLRAIVKRNRLTLAVADAIRDMIGLGTGYLMISEDGPKRALITYERPEQIITEQSPTRPDQVRAGLKLYRDEVAGYDYAFLHLPGTVTLYRRAIRDEFQGQGTSVPTRAQDGWERALDTRATKLNFVPIFPLVNRGGLGEFETHTDILDRINWNILQRLVITAMQAYRQRATTGGPLPREDTDGNEIDYDELFKPGPGALWELPEGVELWESTPTDIANLLLANKDDIRDFGAVTRTPMSMLLPDGANQSAEGATFAKEGLIFKAKDRLNRADDALVRCLGGALAIERGAADIVEGVEVAWLPVERQSLGERADAATKAQDLPWRTRMRDIWGYSDEVIDDLESERAADALNASLALTPLNAPQPPAAPQPPDGQQPG